MSIVLIRWPPLSEVIAYACILKCSGTQQFYSNSTISSNSNLYICTHVAHFTIKFETKLVPDVSWHFPGFLKLLFGKSAHTRASSLRPLATIHAKGRINK